MLFTPKQAAHIQRKARTFLTTKIITASEFAVLDCLLWRVRRVGEKFFTVTYDAMARLTNLGRDAVINAIKKFQTLGLLVKHKRRVRVRWGHNHEALASRQIANGYEFVPLPTESAYPTTDKGRVSLLPLIEPAKPKKDALQMALDQLGATLGLTAPG